jgi:hypothetical protein
MNSPRFRLASALIAVAVLALNLGVIRADSDGLAAGYLLIALPTINALAAVGVAGLRRRLLRAFAAGFVAAGTSSLIGFHVWASAHPWTFLRYAEPLCQAIDRLFFPAYPDLHSLAVNAVLAVAFVVPHAIIGLAGGGLTASGWAMVSRRGPVWSRPPLGRCLDALATVGRRHINWKRTR